mmetsp:Transcript_11153/g.33448  ORF Transcript_11153/g.33448 Transcript_11153/m.33448 type:complete len:453 (+) Transcript_11153:338-1696(+)
MAGYGVRGRVVEDEEGNDDGPEELDHESRAFEREYVDDHSWEDLQEDEHGRLRALDPRAAQRAKRRRLLSEAVSARIRRGLIRYLEVIVDLSRASSLSDFRPTRASVVAGVLAQFIREFFDQNPLSHLGIIVLRGGVAERLTDLSGNPEAHIARLQALDAAGDASLQNGLDLAVAALKSIPPYGHREVLILLSALSTVDPGDILVSIKAARQHRVRASVVGLSAQVHVCELLTKQTGGTYSVALDERHLEEVVRQHAPPPPTAAASTAASMVRMGFPQRNAEGVEGQSFIGSDARLGSGGFTCPRCKARVSELPGACHVCALTLVSSPHLARSYHHLFPVPPFAEVTPVEIADLAVAAAAQGGLICHACCCALAGPVAAVGDTSEEDAAQAGVVLRCDKGCRQLYCFDCDLYIHESLHVCPGCEAAPTQQDEDHGGAEVANGRDGLEGMQVG